MRKFFRSLAELSLVQQLSVIVFTFAFVLILFFTVYLRGNIDDFVSSQVMDSLKRSQENIVATIEESQTVNPQFGIDYEMIHMVFSKGVLKTYYGNQQMNDELIAKVAEIVKGMEESIVEAHLDDGHGYYYRAYTIDKNRVIVSLVADSYATNIESRLLSSVSNTSAIMVSVMFLMFLMWTLSVVAPLQQIRNYINKIRKGEEAVLTIDRNDEIGDLAHELVSLREELQHQYETKEEMVHNISHDLKTPIATIKSYAESIKDGIYPYDTLEKSVDVIIDNADRLEQKVHSLLFLNRLDYVMDQEKDTDKVTDMKSVIEKVLLSLKMIRPDLSIDCRLEDTFFKGDEEGWRVVVENLLDNAMRYAETNITLDLKKTELSVANDGPAISEERMQRLFKPFEKGTKGKFGLGLSICYKVCQAYGYDIDAENQEKGVIFHITEKEKDKKEKRRERRLTGLS